jgi:hypothetical protein
LGKTKKLPDYDVDKDHIIKHLDEQKKRRRKRINILFLLIK